MAEGGAGGAIRAGAAFVELFADDTALTKGLNAVNAKLASWGKSVMKVGGAITGLGAAVSAPLTLAAKTWAESGSEMLEMSERTGASVESLSRLKGVLSLVGLSMEDFRNSFKQLQNAQVNAAQGNEQLQRTFARLGLNPLDLASKPLDQQLDLLADAFKNVENPALKTAMALDLFGEAGAKMLPLLNKGAGGLGDARREIEAMRLVMTTEGAERANRLNNSLRFLSATSGELWATLGSAAAPTLEWVTKLLTQVNVRAIDWANNNQSLIGTVYAVATGATVLGAALTNVGLALFGAAQVGKAVAGVFGLILSPLGLVAVALGAAAVALYKFTSLGDVMRSALGGIMDALSAGDLEGAWNVAQLAIRQGWLETKVFLLDTWNEFTAGVMVGWDLIKAKGVEVANGIQVGWHLALVEMVKAWNIFAAAVKAGADMLPGGLGGLVPNLPQANLPGPVAIQNAPSVQFQKPGQDPRVKALEDELVAAQFDLMTAAVEAAQKAKAKQEEKAAAAGGIGLAGVEKTVGTFNAFAAAGLGTKTLAEQQVKEAKKGNELLGKAVDKLDQIAVAAAMGGLAFL